MIGTGEAPYRSFRGEQSFRKDAWVVGVLGKDMGKDMGGQPRRRGLRSIALDL